VHVSVPEYAHIALKVFNIQGQMIRTLMDEEMMPGVHPIMWDGRDEKGHPVGNGMYILQFEGKNFLQKRKVLHIK